MTEPYESAIYKPLTFFCCTSSAPPVSLKLQHSWWNSIIEHRRSCLPCTALPYSHTAAYPQGIRHSMCCADSSEWGLFGHNTRSAFRRTPSRKMQPILQRRSHFLLYLRTSALACPFPTLLAIANSLVATFAKCSPYFRSLEIFAKWVAPFHSPQIANYEQVPIGYLMTMR